MEQVMKKEKKILTIVMPCYNVEKYSGEALDSIVKCKNFKEIDVIAVNDGSTDHTLGILRGYQQKFPEIRVIEKQNGGHGSAVNTGLKYAVGRFFSVVDGDDWVEPAVLNRLVEFLRGQKADVVVTGHYCDYMETGFVENFSYIEKAGFQCSVAYILKRNYLLPMTDLCYKTELLKRAGFKMQEHTFYVDEEFCTIPFQKVKTLCFFSKGYYHYRIGDPGQSISDENVVRHIGSRLRVFYRLANLLHKGDMPKDNFEYIRRKVTGIAKAIIRIYYLQYPDRRRGRKLGKRFYQRLYNACPAILQECKRADRIFMAMNRLHFGMQSYVFLRKLGRRKTG